MPCTARALACLLVSLSLATPSFSEEPPPAPPAAEPAPPEAPETEGPAEAAPAEPEPDGGEIQPEGPRSDFVIPVEEINKTAARSKRDVLDVPGNVTRITREQIERSGARDVPELLRREAGVFVTNDTTNREGYRVEFRGFNNGGGNGSSTLVMIDGRRVNEPSSSVVDWAFVPLDNVESIEVARGPASALYGDNAVAGVIHIHTLRPERGLRAIVRGRSGSFDTDGGSAWLGGGAGPVTASAYFDGYQTDGFREHSALRGARGQMDIAVDLLGRGEIGIRGGYDSSRRLRPGALTRDEIDDDRRQAAPGSLANLRKARERFGQLWLDLDLSEELSFHFDGHHRRRNDRDVDGDPFFSFASEGESDAAGLNAQLELDTEILGHRTRTILGGDWLQEDADFESVLSFFPFDPASTFLSDTAARRKLMGLYLQEELSLTEDLILSAGLRRDTVRYRGTDAAQLDRRFRDRFEEWSPKGALTWRVAEPVSLYASYSRGFRFPNIDEAFGFFGFSPALEPQTSDGYEVGAKIRTRRVAVNLAVYDMDVEDEIFLVPLPPPLAPLNLNVDRVRHRGAEIWANVRPCDWLELYGSYTWDDVKFQRLLDSSSVKGLQMPITPRHRGNLGFTVFLPWGFEIGANANYVGSRFATNDVANVLKIGSYASYDLRAGWRYELPRGVTLGVEGVAYNVTDREYVETGGFSLFSPRIAFFPAPGRNYLASFFVEYQM
jgi:outer membrane receptor protein involved in Fe transport